MSATYLTYEGKIWHIFWIQIPGMGTLKKRMNVLIAGALASGIVAMTSAATMWTIWKGEHFVYL